MSKAVVRSGLDNIGDAAAYLAGKRVGLLTHPCGFNREAKSAIDVINDSFKLEALFGCEHGLRGELQAGVAAGSGRDSETGAPIYSLYGDTKAPTPDMLADIDVFVIDLQDVGARFYTYLYSMSYSLKACAEAGVPVVILDRLNPLGGEQLAGTVLDEKYHSFVGEYAVPTRYALTIGEFARYCAERLGVDEPRVVALSGWKRDMYLDDTDALWAPPSPNMPTLASALMYVGTCAFEGTNISEGRGTTEPFSVIGAPFIDGAKLEARMRAEKLDGVLFQRCAFRPTFSKWSGELCGGVRLHATDRRTLDPFEAGLVLLEAIMDLYPNEARFNEGGGIDRLLGEGDFSAGRVSARELAARHRPLVAEFAAAKRKYHLYE